MSTRRTSTALAAIGGLGATSLFLIAPPASAAIPLCQAANLQVSLELSQGAAGHHYDTWRITNVGGTCHTQGWVGALNFESDGRPLPTTVQRVGTSSPITLTHGQRASWIFGYGNPAILRCHGENATAMIITPPDNVSPVLAPGGEPACDGAITATPLSFER